MIKFSFLSLSFGLCVAYTVLSALDFHSTRSILLLGGRELNKLVAWLMEKLGRDAGLALAKLVSVIGMWVFYYFDGWHWLPESWPVPPFLIGLFLICVIYAVVVQNNYSELRIQRSINQRVK